MSENAKRQRRLGSLGEYWVHIAPLVSENPNL